MLVENYRVLDLGFDVNQDLHQDHARDRGHDPVFVPPSILVQVLDRVAALDQDHEHIREPVFDKERLLCWSKLALAIVII